VGVPGATRLNCPLLASDYHCSRAALGIDEAAVVYCCLNHPKKVTSERFQLWLSILQAVPGSVLMYYHAGQQLVKDAFEQAATAKGIAAHRLIGCGKVAINNHYSRYRLADVFLDTAPYTAHTTAVEALRCGLPVLTIPGRTHNERLAASIVAAAGMAETICHTTEEYTEKAIRIGHDAEYRISLKRKLQELISSAPLFNTQQQIVHLEKAYHRMHRNRLKGQPPAPFIIH